MLLRLLQAFAAVHLSLSTNPEGQEIPSREFCVSYCNEPSPVAIVQIVDSAQVHVCAGAAISDQVIISAAHPFRNFTADHVFVKAWFAPEPSNWRIKSVMLHPTFDKNKLKNDMAVIVLAQKFPPDEKIPYLKVPQVYDTKSCHYAQIHYWTKELQTECLDMPLVDPLVCNVIYKLKHDVHDEHDGILCTGQLKVSPCVDAECNFEVGSPIVCFDNVLVGIVPYGIDSKMFKPNDKAIAMAFIYSGFEEYHHFVWKSLQRSGIQIEDLNQLETTRNLMEDRSSAAAISVELQISLVFVIVCQFV